MFLRRFEHARSLLLQQNLRYNQQEQMDRWHPVYNFRHAVRCRILFVGLVCVEPRSILLPIAHIFSKSGTKGAFPAEDLPVVPLDLYQLCVNKVAKYITILQISLSLSFGERSATLSNFPIPRI